MPRRRKTKTTPRPKPKLPDGDEGRDLDAVRRKEKLDLLIKDFEEKSQTYIDDLERYKVELLKSLEGMHRTASFKLKPIMNLPIKDFLSAGGSLDEAAMKAVSQADREIEAALNEKFKLDKIQRPLRRVVGMDTISEEGGNNENQAPKTRRKGGMPAPSTNQKLGASSRNSVRGKGSKFVTPYHGQVGQASSFDTPLQTPRFNPRLPMTPWVKVSEAGSPIQPADDDVDLLVGGNLVSSSSLGKTIETIPDTALEKLQNLYQHLDSIFKHHGIKQ